MSEQMENDAWLAGFEIGYGDWASMQQYIKHHADWAHFYLIPEFNIGFLAGNQQVKKEKLQELVTGRPHYETQE